jgi:hypothetical protein
VDHIYGRRDSLVPPSRPHMFAQEIEIYVDYLEKQTAVCNKTPKEIKYLKETRNNLEKGMELCLNIAKKEPYPGENLSSIPPCIEKQKERLNTLFF